MKDSPSLGEKQPVSWGEQALAAIAVLVFLSVLVFLFLNRDSVARFFTEAHFQPLSISTNPSGATVLLDGEEIGTSPLTVSTAPGPHTLVVQKPGFEEYARALNLERDRYERGKDRSVKLVQAAEPWIVNVELVPTSGVVSSPPSVASSSAVASGANPSPQLVEGEISKSPDPEASDAVEARMRLLDQRIDATNEKVDFAVTLKLAIIAMLVAIFLAVGVQAVGHFRK